MIVLTGAIGRKDETLLSRQCAVEMLAARDAETAASAARTMAMTAAIGSAARQAAKPTIIEKAVAVSLGFQRGNRCIGGLPGRRYHGR